APAPQGHPGTRRHHRICGRRPRLLRGRRLRHGQRRPRFHRANCRRGSGEEGLRPALAAPPPLIPPHKGEGDEGTATTGAGASLPPGGREGGWGAAATKAQNKQKAPGNPGLFQFRVPGKTQNDCRIWSINVRSSPKDGVRRLSTVTVLPSAAV